MPQPKIVFLDRDGVINRFPGFGRYVTKKKDLRLLPRSAEAIASLNRAGFEIYVISNQGSVSRGLITEKKLAGLTQRMLTALGRKGARINGVFYCIHQTSDNCDCKKPKIALFKKALAGKKVNFRSTFFVGDSREDLMAGKTAGCCTVLVLSGRLKKKDIKDLPAKPDAVKKNLWEVARWILQKKR
ncbi:MAG: HAD-IIIA family hydrolase [Candidatus Omnitrophica bacterium]|nr:HAD-IIIA family hydrolase [Candidatus Omnitrophota bacterium]